MNICHSLSCLLSFNVFTFLVRCPMPREGQCQGRAAGELMSNTCQLHFRFQPQRPVVGINWHVLNVHLAMLDTHSKIVYHNNSILLRQLCKIVTHDIRPWKKSSTDLTLGSTGWDLKPPHLHFVLFLLETTFAKPWTVWLSWLEHRPVYRRVKVQVLVRPHTQVMSSIPKLGHKEGNPKMFLSHRCFPLPPFSFLSLWNQW